MSTTLLWRVIKAFSTISLLLATTLVYADEHHHQSNAQLSAHTLKPGEKWKTDEVVKLGMNNIRLAIADSQDDIVKGRLSAQDYQRIANVIDKNTTEIIKNCKLPKDVDSAFHAVVIVDLLDGVTFMRTSKNIQAQRVGALGVLQTLRNYGKYFEHTGWNLDDVKSH